MTNHPTFVDWSFRASKEALELKRVFKEIIVKICQM